MEKHNPVLLQEVMDSLDLKEGETVLDSTVGAGGHSEIICRRIGISGEIIGIDLDREAIRISEARLKKCGQCRFFIKVGNYRDLGKILKNARVTSIDKALFDLGMSSMELDSDKRGFSFARNAPLNMNYSRGREGLRAEEIVNEWSEESLATILNGYGEEKFSKNIAKEIVETRKEKRIKTTFELVEIIKCATPKWYHRRRIHFATKTFQALRIAVNDELEILKIALSETWTYLSPGGRVAVISFHSLEDRVVKRLFRDLKNDGKGSLVFKKAIRPGREETIKNPRARSAKLRVIEKI